MDYVTIRGEAQGRYEEKHSVFLASVKGISSFEEGLAFAKAVSKKYSDATHNCYAILTRTGEQKFSDDGEPQGTAGTPILQSIKRNDLTDVVCVVTRYFGGIKLGASGLVSAYAKAAAEGFLSSEKILRKECAFYRIAASYADHSALSSLIAKNGGKLTDTRYDEGICVDCAVPLGQKETFENGVREAFGGKRLPKLLGTGYETYLL